MDNSIKERGSFVRAVIRDKETAYLVCSNDISTNNKIAHSVLMQWDNGNIGNISIFNQYAAGLDVLTQDKPQMIAVSEYGDVVLFGSGEHYQEKITDSIRGLKIDGPLRCVKVIEEKAFVVGANFQVFSRIKRNEWLNITPAHEMDKQDKKGMNTFESIDGFSSNDIYTVGWGGRIHWLKNGKWNKPTSPTNLILSGVCCAPDGFVYICGQLGVLLRGRENEWEVINTDVNDNFWNMTWFKGRLYISTFNQLFELIDEELHMINLSHFNNPTFFDLSSEGNLMWSIGAKDILAFNGSDWWREA